MAILEEKTINGRKVQEFKPDHRMQLFAYAMSCDPKYVGGPPEDALAGLGLRRDLFTRWQRDYNPHFEEWLEGVIMTFRGNNVKRMIEFVGLQKAFTGEFNFWKAFALREKVIQPDQLNHGLIPSTLGVYSEWSEQQVEQHRNTLLEALRGNEDPAVETIQPVADTGRPPVAPEIIGGGSEVHPRGTPALPEIEMALVEGVGADGERPPFEREPF